VTPPVLDPGTASRLAEAALGHVRREFPNKLDHVMAGHADVRSPRALHPVFYGSFDWHSSVHAHWLLARLFRRFPALPVAAEIRAVLDEHLVPAGIEQEIAYLRRPEHAGFERPYGWAWLLELAAELSLHRTAEGRRWSVVLHPLAAEFVTRFGGYLPRATYPVRVGTHGNSAFALHLALDYAEAVGDQTLGHALRGRAAVWYAADRDARPWEPSGEDFLSPTLMEAECMRRVLPHHEFVPWFERFLPGLEDRDPGALFQPAHVSDRADGRIVHLDGLNLSRAWCWASLATVWSAGHPIRSLLLRTAEEHLDAALAHVIGDYMGEHWLASFALLALEALEDAHSRGG
jgi:hypothetical protein